MSMPASAPVQHIRKASRHLVRELGFLNRTIAGTDLSASGVHAVLEIGLCPGITARDLAARLKLEKSTVSRLVKSLRARGEIRQVRSGEDRRAYGLSLTQSGQEMFTVIDRFGEDQVRGALSHIETDKFETIVGALSLYADALEGKRSNGETLPVSHSIVEGYQTGMIGDVAALHARTHGPTVGMGPIFESMVSKGMAEFMPRLENPLNNSWSILENGEVLGSISIDGENLGPGIAHLRWFILSERLRGKGLGRQLLDNALQHCDGHGFREIHLWTLKGLDAARSLYEKLGFLLVDEYIGDQWGKSVTEQKFIRRRPG